jgi:hypothetical protein
LRSSWYTGAVNLSLKNRASLFLSQLPGSVDTKCQQFSITTPTFYAYVRGDRKPPKAKRAEIHEAGGPEPEWWAEPVNVTDAPLSEPPAAEPITATPAAIADTADELLGDVRRDIKWLREHPAADPSENIRNRERAVVMLTALSKMRGMLMSEAQIVASPYFVPILSAITNALAPFGPEPLGAVTTALEELTAGS